ncbi:pilus assembly FimT family protein [Acinetobacter gyllenbergii]|uniref:pilus assembly FimT family protein n=1 Tax=Acinetobacter gyllenbergii TaxID=134534 RepID=UPI0009D6AAC9|nr:prepilin-type N-terminal cleavage/methylation domain-containing protein [Acinetobacter gyllenbergii]
MKRGHCLKFHSSHFLGEGFIKTRSPFTDPHSGFTMIELIVTVAVLAIVATLAAPSFTALYTQKKIESVSNTIKIKVSEARSQAVLLRDTTGLCLDSLSKQSCSAALSIPETDADRIFWVHLAHGVSVVNTSATSLLFNQNGGVKTSKNFELSKDGFVYCIQVGIVGDTIIKKGACT